MKEFIFQLVLQIKLFMILVISANLFTYILYSHSDYYFKQKNLKLIVELINGEVSVYTISDLEEERKLLIEWIDGGTNIKHPIPLKWVDSDANILGLDIERQLHKFG